MSSNAASPFSSRSFKHYLSLFSAFALGACVTAATQSSASEEQPSPFTDPSLATVLRLIDSPKAMAPNGKAQVQHLARGKNAYIGRLEMEAGASVPEHRDATEEYIHILKGSGTLTIDGFEHELEPGSTVFMPANALVSYQNGDSQLIALQVFAGPQPAEKYSKWRDL